MSATSISSRFSPQMGKLRETFDRLSDRERTILFCAIGLGILFGIWMVFSTVSDFFDEQSARIAKLENDSEDVKKNLLRYAKLRALRDSIESEFRGGELKEGALSYLEGLLSEKAGIGKSEFSIRDGGTRPFGTEYEQGSFSIRFTIQSYEKLVNFLREIVDGKKPLMLRRLSMQRRRGSDRLELDIDINSIRKIR